MSLFRTENKYKKQELNFSKVEDNNWQKWRKFHLSNVSRCKSIQARQSDSTLKNEYDYIYDASM